MAKDVVRLLPNDRPYTEIEAVFCVQLDHNNNKSATVEGYAKLWGWSRKRVRVFLARLGVEIIYPEDPKKVRRQRGFLTPKMGPLKGHKRGHITFIDFSQLQRQRDISGAINGATTHEKEKREKKKREKDPRVKVFLEWFKEKYHKRFGKEYLVTNWAQAGSQVKALLGLPLSFEDLQYVTIEFLLDDDPWLEKVGHHLGTLLLRINQNAYAKYLDPDFKEANKHHIVAEAKKS